MPTTQAMRDEEERAAEGALAKFVSEHPEVKRAEIPAPLKWAAAITGAIMTAMVASFFVWLTSAVNEMQVTVARIDERQTGQVEFMTEQLKTISTRVEYLEQYHRDHRNRP